MFIKPLMLTERSLAHETKLTLKIAPSSYRQQINHHCKMLGCKKSKKKNKKDVIVDCRYHLFPTESEIKTGKGEFFYRDSRNTF